MIAVGTWDVLIGAPTVKVDPAPPVSTVTAARHDLRTSLRRATDALPRASIGTAPILWRNVEQAEIEREEAAEIYGEEAEEKVEAEKAARDALLAVRDNELAASAMGLLRGIVGFLTFLLAFALLIGAGAWWLCPRGAWAEDGGISALEAGGRSVGLRCRGTTAVAPAGATGCEREGRHAATHAGRRQWTEP